MKKIALLLFISALSISAFGQKGTIRGFVYDKGNSEPVIFTNVYLKGTSYGSPTDINGYFTINQIPPGTYELMITYLGYDTLKETIVIKGNELLTKKYYLEKAARTINEVQIIGNRGDDTTQTQISKETVTPIEIKQVPTIGSPDIVQYI
ncbi:MAG TPA: carboxypeptidase-like regulatory domain-containing protein, partial [Bacteroidales bacterium]|nr:carboxypeptidase-like regulatory domain-containing protein [Bacteroidales bacterium]